MTLMLDTKDSRTPTLEELMSVPLPVKTDTYQPVAHKSVVDLVLDTMCEQLPVSLRDVRFGLASKGKQMFGVAQFDSALPGAEWGLAVGFRNSYDKSISLGLCSGASVFVCSNLCFSGDGMTVLKRHTPNVWESALEIIQYAAAKAMNELEAIDADLTSFRGIEMSPDAAAAALGIMYQRDLIRSGELIRALDYFRAPPHDEHNTGDLCALYQGVNHALKRALPHRAMAAHSNLHGFAIELREVEGVWQELPTIVTTAVAEAK